MHDVRERSAQAARSLLVSDLGTIDYMEAWELQKTLAQQVAEGSARDTLLLLEHPHTYTCGRRGGREHILLPDDELTRLGIRVLDVDRGGDVTYHGPGQMVAYPILRLVLEGSPVDYHAYLRTLEQVLIDTLAEFEIDAVRVAGYSGVWVGPLGGENKIAAIGVKVDGRGVSTHGIALNVTTDLAYFGHIVPCGITDKGVTSMAAITGAKPDAAGVRATFTRHFLHHFPHSL